MSEQKTVQEESLPKITVSSSKIHGSGVYAAQSIPRGMRIIEYAGEKIPAAEGTRRANLNPDHIFVFSLDDDWDIDGASNGNDARFINHSCSPNAEVLIESGKIWIVAMRDIAEGEEISYDYAYEYSADEKDTLAKCECGATSCRGFIKTSN